MSDAAPAPHDRLNALGVEAARSALVRCCSVPEWVEGLLAERPFASTEALMTASDAHFAALSREQKLTAFAAHPEIGASLAELRAKFQTTAELSAGEQAGVASADEQTLLRLRDGNREYRARFGYVFIVRASGKSAAELLAALEARLGNDAARELEIAGIELSKIARLRLEKLPG